MKNLLIPILIRKFIIHLNLLLVNCVLDFTNHQVVSFNLRTLFNGKIFNPIINFLTRIGIIPILLFSLIIGGCSKKEKKTAFYPPVKVATVETKNVPYYIDTVGHIESINSVKVRSQVTGVMIKKFFERGSFVKKDSPLFEIDKRPFIADLQKKEAILEKNRASLNYNKDKLQRNTPLVKDDYISRDYFDNLQTQVLEGDAVVKENIADVENAKIDLGYCSINAEISGVTGDILFTPGNLVEGDSDQTLVKINQISPIFATFFIPEQNLLEVKKYNKESALKTVVSLENNEKFIGNLFFIDNEVDKTTGMIKLKSILENEDKILWPEKYVKIQLMLYTIKNAKLVPIAAIQNSVKGRYLYVIDENQTAQLRYVSVGQLQKDDTYVILKGVRKGERVVTDGHINLYPGVKVKVSK